MLLRAIGEGKVEAPVDIVARWTWRLARSTRKIQDRRASADLPEAKRLLGALTNSRGHRHEENAARLVNVALEQPIHVAAALLASAEAYTPTAQRLIDGVRERIGIDPRSRQRARRQPSRAEAAVEQVAAPAPQEAAQGRGGAGQGPVRERAPQRRQGQARQACRASSGRACCAGGREDRVRLRSEPRSSIDRRCCCCSPSPSSRAWSPPSRRASCPCCPIVLAGRRHGRAAPALCHRRRPGRELHRLHADGDRAPVGARAAGRPL